MSKIEIEYKLSQDALRNIAIETGEVICEEQSVLFDLTEMTVAEREVVLQDAQFSCNGCDVWLTLREPYFVNGKEIWMTTAKLNKRLDSVAELVDWLNGAPERVEALK